MVMCKNEWARRTYRKFGYSENGLGIADPHSKRSLKRETGNRKEKDAQKVKKATRKARRYARKAMMPSKRLR